MGAVSYFDFDNRGQVVIIDENNACWRDVLKLVGEADSYIREKTDELKDKGYDYGSRDEWHEFSNRVRRYTDGKLIHVSWTWDASAVKGGESAGVCIADG